MATPKMIVEYAKSNKSSCKVCSELISAHALRIALVVKDPRGFTKTNWHHIDCFPQKLCRVVSVKDIQGFSSLKVCDQEVVKKLETLPNPLKRFQMPELMDVTFSASEVKDTYKGASLRPGWKAFQTLIFLEKDNGLHDSHKIAAFDFDGCLVRTSLNRVGPDAWSLLYESIPEKLKVLYEEGYKLVIFTNEANIERWKNKRQHAIDSKLGRLNNFIKLVDVPIQVFVACGVAVTKDQVEDPYRKPKPGMWRIMEKYFNSGLPIDLNESFFVGDAAGRDNDHSDADIGFAKAIGLKFYVPEEYFC